MNEIVNSFKESISTRFTNPFFAILTLFLVGYNWELFTYAFLGSASTELRWELMREYVFTSGISFLEPLWYALCAFVTYLALSLFTEFLSECRTWSANRIALMFDKSRYRTPKEYFAIESQL